MRLSRKKAIQLCIELWTWLAKTGKLKSQWPGWRQYDLILSNCWFCEYNWNQQQHTNERTPFCRYCPYFKAYKERCDDSLNGNYVKWENAETPHDRKKYAKLFLEQIKTIV